MKKWKCQKVECVCTDRCLIESDNRPRFCPYTSGVAIWDELTEPQLPKLTVEVFNRPDCPEWAKFAAVNESGRLAWFGKKPYLLSHSWYAGIWGRLGEGIFDSSDWQHSIIERPAKREFKVGDVVRINIPGSSRNRVYCSISAINHMDGKVHVYFSESSVGLYEPDQLELVECAKAAEAQPCNDKAQIPDWCKVGAWVWVSINAGIGTGYRKIVSIDKASGWINFGGGYCTGIRNVGETFFEARVRPWTPEDAANHVGKAVRWGDDVMLIVAALKGGLIFGAESQIVISFRTMASVNATLLDGSPCGVLEHLEDGKWVE